MEIRVLDHVRCALIENGDIYDLGLRRGSIVER